ncbi:unnamed protein product [Calicophoron daubneyi]|uniref:Selenoprotein F n=1 Tax=Calicophoron daubneyi TaxID=300641 RepID=A0AAV2TZZ7_CALDB
MLLLFRALFYYFFVFLNKAYCSEQSNCSLAGFTSQLKCSLCHELELFKLKKLEDSCLQCCTEEADSQIVKVSTNYRLTAESEISERSSMKLETYKVIGRISLSSKPGKTFLGSTEKNKLKGLKIRYIKNQRPCIRLYNKNHELQEEVIVDTWDTVTMLDFLHDHLEL